MIVSDIQIDSLIKSAYDQAHMDAAGTALTVSQVRDAIMPSVVAYLEGGDRDFEREAALLIDATLRRERPKRANQLRRDLEYIADFFENPDSAAFGIEAYMQRAYPLGTQSGEDKLLFFWSRDDLRNVVTVRYREAADVTEAAKRFDETTERILGLMGSRGAATLGSLMTKEATA